MAGYVGFSAKPKPVLAKQGEQLEIPFGFTADGTATGTPLDITGAVINAQVRDSSGNLVATFNVLIEDGLNGLLRLFLTAAQTAAITAGASKYSLASEYEWDAFITRTGDTRKAFVALSTFAIEPAATPLN